MELTPFQVVYRKPPPSLPTYSLGTSKIEAVDTTIAIREEIRKTLKQNILQAQQSIKQKADAHKTNFEFQNSDGFF